MKIIAIIKKFDEIPGHLSLQEMQEIVPTNTAYILQKILPM